MFVETLVYKNSNWEVNSGNFNEEQKNSANVVFVFGVREAIKEEERFQEIKEIYPNAKIVGCSTSGNIVAAEVSDCSITATAVYFEKSQVEISYKTFDENDNVEELSREIIEKLPKENLKHIFVLSDGLLINGSELVRGINKVTKDTTVTGGMAGDGAKFEETYVIADNKAQQSSIVAVGFYGENLHIGTGCFAGWSEFGASRTITKSKGNVLYEIDGEPALDLYKKYLGELAKELPNSGLRFPLSIKEKEDSPEIIRTLLAVDHEEKTITYAGDVPEGYTARLMKADIDLLIDGAGKAAEAIQKANENTALGLLVSCVGRKIVMDYLVDDELEEVQNILGENVKLTGFYSYGEIAPFKEEVLNCELHNQTMTLTVMYES